MSPAKTRTILLWTEFSVISILGEASGKSLVVEQDTASAEIKKNTQERKNLIK